MKNYLDILNSKQNLVIPTRYYYTLENWHTEEILAIGTAQEVSSYTFKDMVGILADNGGRNVNFHELFSNLVFASEGWKAYRLPMNRFDFANRYIIPALVKKFNIDATALYGKGCPDFFLTKNDGSNTFRFVEIKASERSLSIDQVRWADKFSYEFYIFKPAYIYDLVNESEEYIKEKIVKDNKLIRKDIYPRN